MRKESKAAVSAVFLTLLSQHTIGFHIPAASPAAAHAPARSLQQPSFSTASASSRSRPHHRRLLLAPSRRLLRSPLEAEAGGGGSGGGFSSAAGEGDNKVSRKAAKKAKARGAAGPTVELKKKQATGGKPQQVSKSLVAEVLGAQAAKDGGRTADQESAR